MRMAPWGSPGAARERSLAARSAPPSRWWSPAHGLLKRGETARAFPVQAIALGKQVTILALSGESTLPEGLNPRGLIFSPFANQEFAPPQDARVRAAIQRVLARVR